MFGQFLLAERNRPDQVEAIGRAIHAWEPLFGLDFPPRDARLFEPDGTLYAVSLASAQTVTVERRDRRVGRGDLIVVPQARALDIEPEVDFLGVRYEGTPPDHFRERFIQVWGFEHLPAPPRDVDRTCGDVITHVIPPLDVRHRLVYAVWDVASVLSDATMTGLDVSVLVGLEGKVQVVVSGVPGRFDLTDGIVAVVGPGLAYQVAGDGRLGRLTLMTEMLRQARRLENLRTTGATTSPEFPH